MAGTLTPDLCVIGAGASGLAVALAARRLGASVAVVEKGRPGGMSPRTGALALSALSAAARRAALMTSSEPFGVLGEGARVSLRKVHDHIAEIVAENAADDGAARLAALGIDFLAETGTFTDPATVMAGDTTIRARRFVIATGAHPVVPDLPGLSSVPWFTPETIFDNTRKLTHLVVAGAGPSGLELALAYRRLGAEVSVVEPGRPLFQSDPELAEIALRRLVDEGVKLYGGATITAVGPREQGMRVDVRSGEQIVSIEATHILVAAGRAANLDLLNLEAGRIRRAPNDTRALLLTSGMRTSNRRVYAVGEAAGHAPAPHLSAPEAETVVKVALLGQATHYDPAIVPRVTLTDPPIAEIGVSEAMARATHKDSHIVYRASYADNDAARAARAGMGVVKLIASRDGHILGAGIVGEGAPDLAALIGLAISAKLTVDRLATFAAPYPSHAELVRAIGTQVAPPAPPGWQTRLLSLRRRFLP